MRILGQYINYKVPINSHYIFIFVNWFFLDDSLRRDAILLCFVKGSLWRGYRTRCYGLQKVNIFSSFWARLLVTNWAYIQTEFRGGESFLRSESCHNRTVVTSDAKSLQYFCTYSLTLSTVNILYVQLLRRQPVHWNLSRAFSLR